MTELVEIHPRAAKPTPHRVPVVVLNASGHGSTSARAKDQGLRIEGPRKVKKRLLGWRREHDRSAPAVLREFEAPCLRRVLALNVELIAAEVDVRPSKAV